MQREGRSIGLAKCLRALSSRLLVFLSVWPPVSPVVLLSGEHELEQGLSLSSSLISAHHLHPERFMERIKQSREEERERKGEREARRLTRIPSLPNVLGGGNHSCDNIRQGVYFLEKKRKTWNFQGIFFTRKNQGILLGIFF